MGDATTQARGWSHRRKRPQARGCRRPPEVRRGKGMGSREPPEGPGLVGTLISAQ